MNTQPTGNTIKTRASEIWLEPDGIVRMSITLPQAEVVIADAIENTQAVTRVCNGQPRLMFIDARNLISIDRESRACFASGQSAKNTRASAVIVNSPLGKMIVNLFTRLS